MSAYDDAVRSRGMEEKVLKKACTFIACRLVFSLQCAEASMLNEYKSKM